MSHTCDTPNATRTHDTSTLTDTVNIDLDCIENDGKGLIITHDTELGMLVFEPRPDHPIEAGTYILSEPSVNPSRGEVSDDYINEYRAVYELLPGTTEYVPEEQEEVHVYPLRDPTTDEIVERLYAIPEANEGWVAIEMVC